MQTRRFAAALQAQHLHQLRAQHQRSRFGLELLGWQIDLTDADVLTGVELDLLERLRERRNVHLAAMRCVVGELLLLVEVQDLDLGLGVRLRIVVRIDLFDERTAIIEVKALHQVRIPLMAVDRPLVDLGDRRRS
ncbi:MAG TPA: hypothetical protein EYP98_17545, partial [Planctomycetes bacterium]|nr:hypothetical protein [Planctomycetota bacterium]